MPAKQIDEYPLTVAKDRFSALTAEANATGVPFRVLKGGKPWVVVSPVSTGHTSGNDSIIIRPVKRTVAVPDLDVLFAGYDSDFTPVEDAFSNPVGGEKL